MANHPFQNITAYMDKYRILDLSDIEQVSSIDRKEYNASLKKVQLDLVKVQQKVGDFGMRVVIVFEGMDAAGKGGAIKRLIEYLDPRGYRVHSLGPPNQQDEPHHHLRRFWTRLPKRGRITIFDDYSWYGRLLFEPIEGYCTKEQYERTPRQVRDFELALAEEGYCVLKFWIHVDRQEQLRRFKRRLNNPFKSWKLTPEDWRNRQMWDDYLNHAQKMILETDAEYAPWYVIPGDSKLNARIAVLDTVVTVLDKWETGGQLYTNRLDHLRWLEEHGDVLDDD